MKRLLIASIASLLLAAGAAQAADMAMPMPVKAPIAPPPPPSWTGCYGNVGFGYDVWNQDISTLGPTGLPITGEATNGGRGWLGLAGAGCDVEIPTNTFFGNLVIGVLADYQFMDVKGTEQIPGLALQGQTSQPYSWDVGGRIGTLITPALLVFTDGGFTQTRFGQNNLQAIGLGAPVGFIGSQRPDGWFVGGGTEYALNWSWLPIKGLFWRNEYRYSTYSKSSVPIFVAGGAQSPFGVSSRYYEQSVLSSLVWRFNWH
jgi:outer membrane immunogenic protein